MNPQEQLDGFLAKYTPEMVKLANACLKKLRKRLPGATQTVWDNYNALVIGFGPSEKTSHAFLSIALYPRYANLFFLQGVGLSDPRGLLQGSGKIVRSIRVDSPEALDDPGVQDLIAAAIEAAPAPINPKAKAKLVIKSVSAKQRPRLPRA